MLIRVVMGWMSVIGVMLVLAELHVEKVLEYVHVLSYRSGRALIALMAGTITLSAAPSRPRRTRRNGCPARSRQGIARTSASARACGGCCRRAEAPGSIRRA